MVCFNQTVGFPFSSSIKSQIARPRNHLAIWFLILSVLEVKKEFKDKQEFNDKKEIGKEKERKQERNRRNRNRKGRKRKQKWNRSFICLFGHQSFAQSIISFECFSPFLNKETIINLLSFGIQVENLRDFCIAEGCLDTVLSKSTFQDRPFLGRKRGSTVRNFRSSWSLKFFNDQGCYNLMILTVGGGISSASLLLLA